MTRPAHRTSLRAALALLVALLPAPARALLEVCTVLTSPLVFAPYNPGAASPVDGTGTVTVTCTATVSISVSYSIALGTGTAGSFTPRRMTAGTGTLDYNLYTSAARTTVWGDGSGGTGTVADGYTLELLSVTRNYTVHGRIPALQNVAPGAYADTLFVTVTY